MKTVTSPEALRFKQGDSLLSWIPMNTRDLVCIFTSAGKVYCTRAFDITQTTGFGDPIQSLFKFADKERVVAVMGVIQPDESARQPANDTNRARKGMQAGLFGAIEENDFRSSYGETIKQGGGAELFVATESGMGFRFSGDTLVETNRNGRKIANLRGDDAILNVIVARQPLLFTLASDGRGLLCDMEEVPLLGGPGAGVRLIKLKPGARLMAFRNVDAKDKLTLTYLSGKDDSFKVSGLEKGARGTVGRVLGAKRKKLAGLLKG